MTAPNPNPPRERDANGFLPWRATLSKKPPARLHWAIYVWVGLCLLAAVWIVGGLF